MTAGEQEAPVPHVHDGPADTPASDVLLVGHPNVGKSVLFSRMTGVRTLASNYPGTTVAYAVGKMRAANESLVVVDAPGTYSLDPADQAGWVTAHLIDQATRIINVVDATRLERHLPLTLELLARSKPVVVALNMMDEARHQGIRIDPDALSKGLGVPVLPITARTGEGVRSLIAALMAVPTSDLRPTHPVPEDHAERWKRVGALVEEAQTIVHHHHTFGERLEDLSIHPFWGSLIALLVVGISFSLIRIIGEFLISGGIGIVGEPWVELPFGTEWVFVRLLEPLLMRLSEALDVESLLHRVLIGSLVDGRIDFEQSFGILTSGLFIPLGVVGSRGLGPVLIVYGTLAVVWVLTSIVLRVVSRDFRPELLVEIPPYRMPTVRGIAVKMWIRIGGFLREALPIVLATVVVVNLLYQAHAFEAVAGVVEPVVSRLWGMPKEAVLPLLIGVVRKDIALGLLAPLALTTKQLITGSVLLAMFFPCVASLVVLFRELGFKNGLASLLVMLIAVLVTGVSLNLIL